MAKRKKNRQPKPGPKTTGKCMVKGCPNLALERHAGPDGPVWLCGRCGNLARRNLAEEASHQAIVEAASIPLKHAAIVREKIRRSRGQG